MNKYQDLFEPIKIGNVVIKNRYAQSPMGIYPFDRTDNTISNEAIEYFVERARGGVGLIFTGAMSAENVIEKKALFPVLTANPNASVKKLQQLTERVHAFGTKIFIQITFGLGRNTPMPSAKPEENIAPSENRNYYNPAIIHRPLTTEEVYSMIDSFGKAAKIAQRGGADGIEVHSMHGGYLLDAFAMAKYNQRTDEFGGDLEKRCTLAIKLLEAVKKNCGKDFPVSLRFAVKSFANGHHRSALPGVNFDEQGRDVEESIEMAKILAKAGYDCFNVDCGSYDGDYWGKPPVYMPEGIYLPYAEMVKKVVDVPVIVSGRLGNPDLALDAVKTGKTDMVALGRPLLADPELPKKVQTGRVADIRPCVACNEGCVNRSPKGRSPSCAINPCALRETVTAFSRALVKKKVLVVGGGPAGMEAAITLARRGHEVTLAEASDALGGKYRFAALPGFKDADGRLIAWFIHMTEELGVTIVLNHPVSADDELVKESDVVITATGADAVKPNIPGLEKAETVLDCLKNGEIDETKEYTVVGAGLVGCEFAIWLAKKGIKVHIVEMQNDIIPRGKPAKMCEQYIREAIEQYGIDVCLGARLVAVDEAGISVSVNDQEIYITSEKVVYSFGFRSTADLYKELVADGKEVYNLGDSKEPGNIMPGIWDAYEVCRSI